MTELLVAPCSYQAAKYAVEKWHYSGGISSRSKYFKLGVWENGDFVGAIIYGLGASPSIHLAYSCEKNEVCELVRIALKSHNAPVTQLMSISRKILKNNNPDLRLVISFADPSQEHLGIIYQADNWIYTGETSNSKVYIDATGVEHHSRNIGSYNGYDKYGVRKYNKSDMVEEIIKPSKHRYLYPLDRAMRKQIAPLAKPYPKREPASD